MAKKQKEITLREHASNMGKASQLATRQKMGEVKYLEHMRKIAQRGGKKGKGKKKKVKK